MTPAILLWLAGVVLFVLAGCSVTNSTGRIRCEWFAAACLALAHVLPSLS